MLHVSDLRVGSGGLGLRFLGFKSYVLRLKVENSEGRTSSSGENCRV